MNIKKKLCKIDGAPAVVSFVIAFSSLGEKQRHQTCSKSIPLCAKCLRRWARLQMQAAGEHAEEAIETLAGKYEALQSDRDAASTSKYVRFRSPTTVKRIQKGTRLSLTEAEKMILRTDLEYAQVNFVAGHEEREKILAKLEKN